MIEYTTSRKTLFQRNLLYSVIAGTFIMHIFIAYFVSFLLASISFVGFTSLLAYCYYNTRFHEQNEVAIEFGQALQGLYSGSLEELKYQHAELVERFGRILELINQIPIEQRTLKPFEIYELQQFLEYAMALHVHYESNLQLNMEDAGVDDDFPYEQDGVLIVAFVDEYGSALEYKVHVVEEPQEGDDDSVSIVKEGDPTFYKQ